MAAMKLLRRMFRRDAFADGAGWLRSVGTYLRAIHDPGGDSAYLRNHGLKPNILDLAGDVGASNVLDVGCGDGWLFDAIRPLRGCECDITEKTFRDATDRGSGAWTFSKEDVASLSFDAGTFDLIVASLVLIFVEDIQTACDELFRVASGQSTLVVAIMHPSFYRMGTVKPNGDAVIQHDYSEARVIPDLFIANKAGPFRYYHRPLSEYVNALSRSGWRITEFREWSIDMDDYRRHCGHVKDGPKRTSRLPLYAFFQCKKDLHVADRPLRDELDT
jgi:SAM-dependent methyltransferase